jgi:hypothetical protein
VLTHVRRAELSLLLIILAGVLVACIRPVDEQPSSTPTAPPVPAVGEGAADALPPPPAEPTAIPTLSSGEPVTAPPAGADPTTLATEFIQRRGDSPSNVAIWLEQQLGADQLHAFSYTGAVGEPCAGFLLTAVPGTPSDNGAIACSPDPAAGVFAGVTLLLTSDGQPYSIAFGQVLDPTIAAITAIFDDGTTNQTQPVQGGFFIAVPGVAPLTGLTAQDPTGTTIIEQVPQSAVR